MRDLSSQIAHTAAAPASSAKGGAGTAGVGLCGLPPLPQPLVTDLVRREIAEMRGRVMAGGDGVGEFEETVAYLRGRI